MAASGRDRPNSIVSFARKAIARFTLLGAFASGLVVSAGCLAAGCGVGGTAMAAPLPEHCESAPHPDRCRAAKKARAQKRADPQQAQSRPAKKSPPIESGGTLPALDNTVPLLRAGTFRLDTSAFYSRYPFFGLGNARPNGPSSSVVESLTLGYGVNERFTIFGGAVESNSSRSEGGYRADFVDPRIGVVYRVAKPQPYLWNTAIDFVGDVTLNEALRPPSVSSGPYGDLGPIFRARALATREVWNGFTLQLSGGFQAAISTTIPLAGLPSRTTEVDALLGLAGQYRLSAISDRLYVNGEIDYLKPLTNDNNQLFAASPFRTADTYSGTLGLSYVVKPGFLIARVSDTVALSVVNGNNLIPPIGPRHFVSNTVGMTLSFVNLTPQNWLRGLAR